jgi:hypothetical protein
MHVYDVGHAHDAGYGRNVADEIVIEEYFQFRFEPLPRTHRDGRGAMPPEPKATEPDASILDAVYRHTLAPLLPRVAE